MLLGFCTFADQDEIQPTPLPPWIGFVYIFPEARANACQVCCWRKRNAWPGKWARHALLQFLFLHHLKGIRLFLRPLALHIGKHAQLELACAAHTAIAVVCRRGGVSIITDQVVEAPAGNAR